MQVHFLTPFFSQEVLAEGFAEGVLPNLSNPQSSSLISLSCMP